MACIDASLCKVDTHVGSKMETRTMSSHGECGPDWKCIEQRLSVLVPLFAKIFLPEVM